MITQLPWIPFTEAVFSCKYTMSCLLRSNHQERSQIKSLNSASMTMVGSLGWREEINGMKEEE